jgi:hypothetical protein
MLMVSLAWELELSFQLHQGLALVEQVHQPREPLVVSFINHFYT